MDRPLAAAERRVKGRGQPIRTQRLFFALWPQPAVRVALSRWRDQAQTHAGGRAMQSRNLHMTLVFLGDIRSDRIPAIQRAAASVQLEPCVLRLDRRAFWKHNHIVWAGGDAPVQLHDAVTQLRDALTAADVGFDAKPFVPHVTLLREVRSFDDAPVPEPIDWAVSEFVLMASGHDAAGLLYRLAAGPFGVDAR